MNRKALIPLAFLLILCIAPLIFPSSLRHLPIAIIKDFSTSEEISQYNVVLASDLDDDCWQTYYNTHTTDSNQVFCAYYSSTLIYAGQMRFQLNITKYSEILSANITWYDFSDITPTTAKAWRIDESNVGPLESDSVMPDIDDSESTDIVFDGSTGWATHSVTNLIQNQVNLSNWISGQYIGFHVNFTVLDAGNNKIWYDYQDANNYHPYLNISYIEASWHLITTAEIEFEVNGWGWHEIGEAIIVFATPAIDPWVLNGVFIILGLVMLPASSLYLVKGGKDEMSTHKLFYGLVIFFVGLALFIGGIMP